MVVTPVAPPGQYAGSVEERAQEALILFHGAETAGGAVEDLILKIGVQGDVKKAFGWIVPFPAEPAMAKEDPALFKEIFDYVEARLYASRAAKRDSKVAGVPAAAVEALPAPVEVLTRKIVGSYDIAVVLKDQAHRLKSVARLFQKLHPGEKYYLTNLQARGLAPDDIRHWSDDLWLFPYYVDTKFVPFDARPGGPAAGAWEGR
jgi:hypothetical protein